MQMSNEEHDTNLQQEEGETDKEIDYITFSIESGMSSREVMFLSERFNRGCKGFQ